MAEIVQKNIESFIPELEQMERVGLATRDQVREILRRRKRFEYRLRRRKRTKEDYLTYIQYEINVYALLQKRRARLRIGQKKLEIDLVIAKRINKLFKASIPHSYMHRSCEKLFRLIHCVWPFSKTESRVDVQR